MMVIVGMDEVGRGAWAGPLVVGAVILNKKIPGLTDSKKLSELQRENIADQIRLLSTAYSLGWVSANELDKIGLAKALLLAYQRSLEQITRNYDQIIIDGSLNFLADNPKSVCVVKADQTVPAVSAASIIAKVSRDEYMRNLALEFPDYGFDSHVGYGTQAHLTNLRKFGTCIHHRKSYKPIQVLL